MVARDCCGGTTVVHYRRKERGVEGDNRGFTIYRFPNGHAAVAWRCMQAIHHAATILDFFPLVPGHQKSRRRTECGSGAITPHRQHLWPREESRMGGGRGGPGLTRGGRGGACPEVRGGRVGGEGRGGEQGGMRGDWGKGRGVGWGYGGAHTRWSTQKVVCGHRRYLVI